MSIWTGETLKRLSSPTVFLPLEMKTLLALEGRRRKRSGHSTTSTSGGNISHHSSETTPRSEEGGGREKKKEGGCLPSTHTLPRKILLIPLTWRLSMKEKKGERKGRKMDKARVQAGFPACLGSSGRRGGEKRKKDAISTLRKRFACVDCCAYLQRLHRRTEEGKGERGRKEDVMDLRRRLGLSLHRPTHLT